MNFQFSMIQTFIFLKIDSLGHLLKIVNCKLLFLFFLKRDYFLALGQSGNYFH